MLIFLIFISSYDKSGLPINLFGSTTVVSYYKILILIFALNIVHIFFLYKHKLQVLLDSRLFKVVLFFIFGQTLVSYLGTVFATGKMFQQSDIYYFMQKLSLIVIPVYAYLHRISPKTILLYFILGIFFHDISFVLQYLSPGIYLNLISSVSNLMDNSLTEWDGVKFGIIGLQRTANYGAFVSSLGILSFPFLSGNLQLKKILYYFIFSISILATLVGGSRSVLLMIAVTVLVLVFRNKLYKKKSFYVVSLAVFILFGVLNIVNLENLTSINRITNEESEGSNIGHFVAANYALQLFSSSPLVGWGNTKFAELSSKQLGNTAQSTSETHSYILSTLVSSGIIGLILYIIYFVAIVKEMFHFNDSTANIIIATFIGLGFYNIIYDVGGLDFFSCFLGVVTYYAIHESIKFKKNNKI